MLYSSSEVSHSKPWWLKHSSVTSRAAYCPMLAQIGVAGGGGTGGGDDGEADGGPAAAAAPPGVGV